MSSSTVPLNTPPCYHKAARRASQQKSHAPALFVSLRKPISDCARGAEETQMAQRKAVSEADYNHSSVLLASVSAEYT